MLLVLSRKWPKDEPVPEFHEDDLNVPEEVIPEQVAATPEDKASDEDEKSSGAEEFSSATEVAADTSEVAEVAEVAAVAEVSSGEGDADGDE